MANRSQMWGLYLTAKATSSRPSDLLDVADRWAAYQLDTAVTMLGTAIENAAQEMENRGTDDAPRWEPRYRMAELLDPEFRLPIDEGDWDPDDLKDVRGLVYDEVS